MNQLSTDKSSQVIAALVEGTPINATYRITGLPKHTVLKLLKDLGCAGAAYHSEQVRNLRVRRVQYDGIWASKGDLLITPSRWKVNQQDYLHRMWCKRIPQLGTGS